MTIDCNVPGELCASILFPAAGIKKDALLLTKRLLTLDVLSYLEHLH
jgi:hypothetical protein